MEPSRSQDRDYRRSRRLRFGVAVLLVLAAVAWLPLEPFQGAVLFDLVPGQAVTQADLVSVALLLVARSVFLSRVGPRPAGAPMPSRTRSAVARPATRPVVTRPVVTRLDPTTSTPTLSSPARPARPAPAGPTPFRPMPVRPAPLRPARTPS